MRWMAYLTADKPAQLRKYLTDVRYDNDTLTALSTDNVGKRTKIICEVQNVPVFMKVTTVGNKDVDCDADVIALI